MQLLAELRNIYASAEKGEFVIEEGVEDVHSQVELMLTRRLGDKGKQKYRVFYNEGFKKKMCIRDRGKGYGLVIIDGIRDLMLDINSTSESVEVINKMME